MGCLAVLFHALAHQMATPLTANTDRVFAAAAEALQRIGDTKRNIVDTPNAPPLLSDLDKQLEAIRTRVGTLKEVKERQWSGLQKPLSIHARATLIAITDICEDLEKGIWIKTEDHRLVLQIRVLTSGWKGQRITASHKTLLTLQHSFDLMIGEAHA